VSDDGLPRQTIAAAEKVAELLEASGVPSVVIGALALATHGYVRATFDLDLAIAVDPSELPRLAAALRASGLEVALEPPDPQDPLGGVLNVQAPGAATIQVVNFDNSPANGFPRLVRDALTASVSMGPGTRLRAADLFSLVGFKLYAGGSKSRLDILELLDRNSPVDLAALRAWCKERRLGRELEKVLALASEP
jgi:hypothetical protein